MFIRILNSSRQLMILRTHLLFLLRFAHLLSWLRSAYLSLLNGVCYMAVVAIIVVRQLPEIFSGFSTNVYAVFTVKSWLK